MFAKFLYSSNYITIYLRVKRHWYLWVCLCVLVTKFMNWKRYCSFCKTWDVGAKSVNRFSLDLVRSRRLMVVQVVDLKMIQKFSEVPTHLEARKTFHSDCRHWSRLECLINTSDSDHTAISPTFTERHFVENFQMKNPPIRWKYLKCFNYASFTVVLVLTYICTSIQFFLRLYGTYLKYRYRECDSTIHSWCDPN